MGLLLEAFGLEATGEAGEATAPGLGCDGVLTGKEREPVAEPGAATAAGPAGLPACDAGLAGMPVCAAGLLGTDSGDWVSGDAGKVTVLGRGLPADIVGRPINDGLAVAVLSVPIG